MTDRRSLLKTLAGAAASAAALAKAGDAAACADATPRQTEGPFYPRRPQADTNWDLTQVEGRTGQAQGEHVYVLGTVTDADCRPVEGALVEIWQACASGRYNHPGDTSGLALDPDFQYWGRVLTGADGTYKFRTVIPGDYPADDTWQRPPHIHFKVTKRAFRELTTQMYFAGHELNGVDHILNAVPLAQRASVVIEKRAPQPAAGLELAWYRFDLGVTRAR